jgi:hypothetical protein
MEFADLVDTNVAFYVADKEEAAVGGEAELGDFPETFELLEAAAGPTVYYTGVGVWPAPVRG